MVQVPVEVATTSVSWQWIASAFVRALQLDGALTHSPAHVARHHDRPPRARPDRPEPEQRNDRIRQEAGDPVSDSASLLISAFSRNVTSGVLLSLTSCSMLTYSGETHRVDIQQSTSDHPFSRYSFASSSGFLAAVSDSNVLLILHLRRTSSKCNRIYYRRACEKQTLVSHSKATKIQLKTFLV